MAAEVVAAGGVVTRLAGPSVEVLIVHRPRYDDWSLPKGKADPGETPEQTARREVAEETGYRCSITAPVGDVRYVDHRGRAKTVHYFAMQVDSGAFAPNDEVDEVAWCRLADVPDRLTYPHDVRVVALATARP